MSGWIWAGVPDILNQTEQKSNYEHTHLSAHKKAWAHSRKTKQRNVRAKLGMKWYFFYRQWSIVF